MFSPSIVGVVFVKLDDLENLLRCQIGRDKGKIKEPRLYEMWGGKPTTVLLRHRDSPLDPTVLALLHGALARVTGVEAPSKRKEAGSPDDADKVYEEYVRYLRDSTRDTAKFPRIFEELVNYGFRRNLWGLKPIGIVLDTIASVAAGVAVWPVSPSRAVSPEHRRTPTDSASRCDLIGSTSRSAGPGRGASSSTR